MSELSYPERRGPVKEKRSMAWICRGSQRQDASNVLRCVAWLSGFAELLMVMAWLEKSADLSHNDAL